MSQQQREEYGRAMGSHGKKTTEGPLMKRQEKDGRQEARLYRDSNINHVGA